jgi:rhodanese-related sulfurtransferase
MSEHHLSGAAIMSALADPEKIRQNQFGLARRIAELWNARHDASSQDIIIRALESKQDFGSSVTILNGLVREIGLFPYLDEDSLSLRDQLAYEYHRPEGLSEEIVFHAPQARVYRALMGGQNVILTAPTSYGKSLIIDAVIASGQFNNIVVVVPTIALIDETRRRLSQFKDRYKIITFVSQAPSERNVFIFTPERIVESKEVERADFFVIDEFYKLSLARHDDRCVTLNHALYKLGKRCKRFYMLGPRVSGVSESFQRDFECLLIKTSFNTVVSEFHRIQRTSDDFADLMSLCKQLKDSTIIFCKSPERTRTVAKMLLEAGIGAKEIGLYEAAKWTARHYHPDWHFCRALAEGIGVHHGRIPRALGHYVVRAFNEGRVKFLVCTSTLIEGVNTRAKNIIIFDNKIARSKYDLFTFNNISGRSGRMFQYFVGHVYLFYPPPEDELPFVDIPISAQTDDTPDSLLVQMDNEDLNDTSRERMKKYEEQENLPIDVLRANEGIEPSAQIALAAEIENSFDYYYPLMHWEKDPTWDQLNWICDLIWRRFDGIGLGNRSAVSSGQLAGLIWALRKRPATKELVTTMIPYANGDPDDAVNRVLDFQRMWASFHFPRLLRCVSRIQAHICSRLNRRPGNYEGFADQVEHLFLGPVTAALDEYGLPLDLARKLQSHIKAVDIDEALACLKSLDDADLNLDAFEREVFSDTVREM